MSDLPWHERDEFWHGFGGPLFDAAAWEAAGEEVDGVLALLRPPPGARVLDLCCGPGRHALELARRGYRVTGVDRTGEFLDACRARAAAEGLEVELVQEDMRAFRREGAFDIAINLTTSFGYFRDPADDRRVLEHVLASLAPDGGFLVELAGKEVLARVFQPRDWRERDDAFFLYERRILDDWRWIENRWIRIDDAERQEYVVGHRLYSAAELADLAVEVGFEEIQVYGGLDGSPYDTQARRLVVTGRKPA